MKNILFVVFISMIFLFVCCNTTTNKNIIETEISDFDKILDSFQVNGSILIYDNDKNTFYSNDFDWAKNGKLPASTFKIPNSIIAVELGIIENDTTILKWNGEQRKMDIWEKDLSFKDAFRISCVPCYQEIARKIGTIKMKEYLEKFEYKNMIFDSLTIDNFWLEGNSKISQKQQIDFLRKFYFSKFPISDRTIKIVKNIMEIERTENYILSGKTGLSSIEEKYNGWFVGYVETKSNVYFFATNVIPTDGLNVDDFISSRINVTKNALKQMNIMLRRIIAFLGDLSLCSRPHFAALRLLYLTLQATVQVAYLIINIIELQFSPCTFLLPIREIFIPFPGFSRYDVPFTNHFLSSFHCFFVGFPCFPLRKCIAIPLFHYATFCFRMSDLLNTSVSGDSSKTVRLVIIVCT